MNSLAHIAMKYGLPPNMPAIVLKALEHGGPMML